ncbi:nuclear transport factor 2 family protein [Pseudomaricurvus alcaniphilus]|uniref:nuclear transport factor 2 family protein n=1 Tax=Pseudomaricurvus alcaniphilus TaxID=1166482 RepID=UPI00140804E4|nr:nuclear transport factor 2 family protein [Pseudomaricurvus alcaniphilus]NHN36523.1 nuclear transport factor 2 family protein [Pseudomaricurvus alcaniphilus]
MKNKSFTIEDEMACIRLSNEFAYYLDHKQYTKAAALFTEDGVFERPGASAKGRSQIVAFYEARPVSPVSWHMCGSPVFISVKEDEAEAITPFTLYHAKPVENGLPQLGSGPAAIAEFKDTYRRTVEGWKIHSRKAAPVLVAEH